MKGGEKMTYEKPKMETLTLEDIQEIVAECGTCTGVFGCQVIFKW